MNECWMRVHQCVNEASLYFLQGTHLSNWIDLISKLLLSLHLNRLTLVRLTTDWIFSKIWKAQMWAWIHITLPLNKKPHQDETWPALRLGSLMSAVDSEGKSGNKCHCNWMVPVRFNPDPWVYKITMAFQNPNSTEVRCHGVHREPTEEPVMPLLHQTDWALPIWLSCEREMCTRAGHSQFRKIKFTHSLWTREMPRLQINLKCPFQGGNSNVLKTIFKCQHHHRPSKYAIKKNVFT